MKWNQGNSFIDETNNSNKTVNSFILWACSGPGRLYGPMRSDRTKVLGSPKQKRLLRLSLPLLSLCLELSVTNVQGTIYYYIYISYLLILSYIIVHYKMMVAFYNACSICICICILSVYLLGLTIIVWATTGGFDVFLSGMARGADFYKNRVTNWYLVAGANKLDIFYL